MLEASGARRFAQPPLGKNPSNENRGVDNTHPRNPLLHIKLHKVDIDNWVRFNRGNLRDILI